MNHRKLGSLGADISEIGFGGWGLGGDSYGPVAPDEARRVVRRAFEMGITFYDTADIYGDGRSEAIIGDALRDVRKKAVFATKVGGIAGTGRTMRHDLSVEHISRSLHASLSRLRTDYVDVYQLHSPPLEALCNEEVLRFLKSLKQTGKIRALGISVRSPEDGHAVVKLGLFDCIQVNFNLIDQRILDNGLLDLAGRNGIGVIARTPLCFGFLTGMVSDGTAFEPGDFRLSWSKEQIKRWVDSVALFEPIWRSRGWTPARFALKFCLAFEGVTSTIPGMMSVREVEENAACGDGEGLSPDEGTFIRDVYRSNTFMVQHAGR